MILYPDFSGVVEIEYTVPVFATEDRSMLAFMPIDLRDIEEKHRSVIRAGGKVDGYTMRIFEDKSEADSEIFPRKSRV
ncbi:MAG: hypothetical protein HY042_02545, partial [Spirochaetia bacterium]|nr:hypothetical protein [Spirochaetia bacterium]